MHEKYSFQNKLNGGDFVSTLTPTGISFKAAIKLSSTPFILFCFHLDSMTLRILDEEFIWNVTSNVLVVDERKLSVQLKLKGMNQKKVKSGWKKNLKRVQPTNIKSIRVSYVIMFLFI